MSWDYFALFAIVALLFWGWGAFAAWRGKRPAVVYTFTCLGLVVFFSFIVGMWISLERPPMRTMGETRLWYSFFLPLAGIITYGRWKYKWILGFSTILSLVFVCINIFKPDFRLLKKRALLLAYKPAAELFTGMLNRKLAQVLLKLAGIDGNISCGSLTGKQLEKIYKELKEYEAVVMSVNPFANAQVCCGGVDTNEIDETTMESRLCPGLYMAGEILDVDGICGGYNLQFAWSSGLIAGRCAAGGAGKQEMKTEPEKWEKKQLGQRNPEKRNTGKKSVEKKNIEKKSVEKRI